ncbi:hypothetical protein SALBM135S_02534 [Streptomyces alboniger]
MRFLAQHFTRRRRELGTRWRKLPAGQQAFLALAHLRCGDTYAQLAVGFGVGVATAYRYIHEAVTVLAAVAPTLEQAVTAASTRAFVILDGTLLPIDRIAADRPFYSGKHKKHGMNVQVITDPFGRLIWASSALPGATHDITAVRTHRVIDALAEAGIKCCADKGYQGAGDTVAVPLRGKHRNLPAGKHAVNVAHAKDSRRGRAGHGHAQGLAPAVQAALQHHPGSPTSSRPSSPSTSRRREAGTAH